MFVAHRNNLHITWVLPKHEFSVDHQGSEFKGPLPKTVVVIYFPHCCNTWVLGGQLAGKHHRILPWPSLILPSQGTAPLQGLRPNVPWNPWCLCHLSGPGTKKIYPLTKLLKRFLLGIKYGQTMVHLYIYIHTAWSFYLKNMEQVDHKGNSKEKGESCTAVCNQCLQIDIHIPYT